RQSGELPTPEQRPDRLFIGWRAADGGYRQRHAVHQHYRFERAAIGRSDSDRGRRPALREPDHSNARDGGGGGCRSSAVAIETATSTWLRAANQPPVFFYVGTAASAVRRAKLDPFWPAHTPQHSPIIVLHENCRPCRVSARLPRRLRSADHGGGWPRDEDPRRPQASCNSRISLRQSGEIFGPGVFAGSRALSHAANCGEGARRSTTELRSWTAEGG